MEAIHKTVLLACPPARAFELFTGEASIWWPAGRRHTGDARSEIRMQPSGRFWERASDGREVELGRIAEWKAGERLLIEFYVGTDAEHPTEVTVSFAAEGGGTRVTIDHRPLPASRQKWQERATLFERSWTMLCAALEAHDEALDHR